MTSEKCEIVSRGNGRLWIAGESSVQKEMTKRAKRANSAAHMALALQGVDWEAIRRDWEAGVSSVSLAAQHGVTDRLIRVRASRKGWATANPNASRVIVRKAAKNAVNRAIAKATAKIEKQVAYTVDECVNESIELSRKLMKRAGESVERAEDGSLGSIATLARTGVDIARKSLGLDATGAGSVSCAIQFNFVARGVDAFGEATSATPDATPSASDATVDV